MKKIFLSLLFVLLYAWPASAQFQPINIRIIDPATGVPITALSKDGTVNTAAQTTGPSIKCYASAATPSAVGADGRDQYVWCTTTGRLNVSDVASSATGSAPPASAAFIGGLTSGATGGLLQGIPFCDDQAFLEMSTATTTEIVALTSGRKIYVCYWLAIASGNTDMTFKRGTGTNCGTGTNTISPAWAFNTTTVLAFSGGIGVGPIFDNRNAGDALCVTNSQAIVLKVFVRFAKY